MKSMVDHPDHYQAEGFECIDVMLAVFGVSAVKSFCLLNVFKYLYRSEKKERHRRSEKGFLVFEQDI